MHMALDDGEGEPPDLLGLRAVGNRHRHRDMHPLAAVQRLLHIVTRFGLHAVHAALRCQRVGAERRPGDQTATAHTHKQRVQRTVVLQQLQRGRALPGNHVGMVKGRDQRHATLLRQALADGFAVFGVAVVQQHLRAIAARGLDLGGGRILRHHDHGGHAQNAGR